MSPLLLSLPIAPLSRSLSLPRLQIPLLSSHHLECVCEALLLWGCSQRSLIIESDRAGLL